MNVYRLVPFAMVALFSVVTPASAGSKKPITVIEGTDIVKLLEEIEHKPELRVDNVGDPMITANYLGTNYVVLFYNCENHRKCTSVQFRAWYDLKHATPLAKINDWNHTSLLGRAYLDQDDDPTIEHTIRLIGGVTMDHIRAERDWFLRAVAEFEAALQKVQEEAEAAQTTL